MSNKLILAFFLVPFVSEAQEKIACRMGGFLMYNRMWHTYRSSLDITDRFAFSDVKAGFSLSKPLHKNWEVRTALGIGIQFVRSNPVYPYGTKKYGGPDGSTSTAYRIFVYGRMNHRTAAQDNYFAEIPLTIHYRIPKVRLGVETGVNWRTYWHTDTQFRFALPPPAYHTEEYGMVTNLTCSITRRLEVKAGWYWGWQYVEDLQNPPEMYFQVRQHYIQAGVFYDLLYRKKKQKGWFKI